MQRNLMDALSAMVDAGTISIADTAEIVCASEVYTRVPKVEDRNSLVPTIEKFQRVAKKYQLPTHNAIAFFSQVLEIDLQVKTASERDALRELLLLALANQGFLFGTSFDKEYDHHSIRPCETSAMIYTEHPKLYIESLYSQAGLMTAPM